MEIRFSADTDVGKKRDHNEDNLVADGEAGLFVVCDGMGGHAAGEVASAIAVATIRETVTRNRDLLAQYRSGEGQVDRYEILQMLEHIVQTACSRIHETAQQDHQKRGMGTTMSMLLILGGRGFVAHVGDSRIYLIRDAGVHQLTEDHSLVNELVRRGKMRRDEVEGSPYAEYKNAVTRAVGVYPSVEADTLDFDILPGDQFLLCSDGLHFYLKDEIITGAFAGEELTVVTRQLIDLANAGGGHDNITAVAVRVLAEAESADGDKAADVNLSLEVLQQIPLFRYCSYTDLVLIMNLTELKDYAVGERIIEEGTPGEHLLVVLRGKVRVHKGEADVSVLSPGEHLGEMALVDRSPRSASATALEPTRIILLSRRNFYAIIRKETSLSVKLLWSFVQVLADRLRSTTQNLSEAKLMADAMDLTSDAIFED
jgi:serine/threonine protein phosphatase PrpC